MGASSVGLADFGSDVFIDKGSYNIIVEFRYRKDRNFEQVVLCPDSTNGRTRRSCRKGPGGPSSPRGPSPAPA